MYEVKRITATPNIIKVDF